MPRLFDEPDPPRPRPQKSGHGATDSKTERPAVTVTQLMASIKGALNDALPAKLRVVGEVSNLSDRNHWFFSLKDGTSLVRCVMFASAARAVRFPVRDGLQVVATGRVDVFPGQGAVQFYVDRLEPVGQGELEMRLRELIEELRGLGYFDPQRKRPLPAIPTRIAVVTSRSAAALQDVINTAGRRWPGCELLHIDVRVQGEQAAPEIAAAINKLSAQGRRLGIDAVILTRGGGSIEDLWAFNERVVADAVFDCALPIVAAIGHETDTTVAELVADHRCATPTQAAMMLVPEKAVLEQQVQQQAARLTLALRRRAQHERQRLTSLAKHPAMSRPERLVSVPRDSVDRLAARLARALPGRVERDRQRLEQLARHLEAVGPLRVLDRGYTLTLNKAGKPIRSAEDAAATRALTTVFADGRVDSTVDGGGAPSESLPPGPTKPKRPKKARDDDSPRLF